MSLIGIIAWFIAHWPTILADAKAIAVGFIALVGSVSVFLKIVEKALKLLVSLFPSLAKEDAWLSGAIAWIDAWVLKNSWLNTLAMNRNVAKVLVFALCLWTMTPARVLAATPDWSSGPTLPLLEVRLAPIAGQPPVTQIAAGAGYQLSAGFFPKKLMGKDVDLLQISLAGIAGLSNVGGTASIALGACTLGDLLCVGFGSDLVSIGPNGNTGLLLGKVTRSNLFALLSLGFSFDPGPHSAAPAPAPAKP